MQITHPDFKEDLLLKNLNLAEVFDKTKFHLEKGATKITIFTMNKEQSNKLKKNHRRNDIAKRSRKRNR